MVEHRSDKSNLTEHGHPYRTRRGKELLSRTKPGADGMRRGGPKGTALLCDEESRSRPGWVCEKIALSDRDFCQRHNGRVPRGTSHYRFSTGRYSSTIPPRYRKAFARALQSRDIADLREELALVEARIMELGEQLSRSESGALWASLTDARLEAMAASARARAAELAGDTAAKLKAQAEQNKALAEMFHLVEQGGRDVDVWRDLLDTIEKKRKLSETQTRKVVAEKAFVTLDVFVATMADVGRILRESNLPPTVTSRVSDAFTRLLPKEADFVVEAEEVDE